MARKMTIELEATAGTVERFYAWVDGEKRIANDATRKRSWTGMVGDFARVKVRVFGMGRARYKLSVDLPGTAEDQMLELGLDRGYSEAELVL